MHKTSNSIGSGAPFLEVNWPEREANRVPSSNANVHAHSYRLSSFSIWIYVVRGNNFTLPLPLPLLQELRSESLHCLELHFDISLQQV